MSSVNQDVSPSRSLPKTAIPAGIVLLAGGIQLALWKWLDGDSSKQVLSSYVMLPLTALLLSVWWLFFSGVKLRLRLGVAAAAAVAVGLFFACFKLEGYSGDFIPKFALRWSRTPEADASHLKTEPQNSAATDAPVERLEISPDDWPQFGGPMRDGIARGERVRKDWQQNPPKLLWKHPVGLGWSSFAIVERFAFTQEQIGPDEFVVCYDAENGKPIWTHSDPARFVSVMGGDGPRATPTIHDSLLYSLGGTGILNCLEPRTGKRIWSRNILEDAEIENAQWGMTGSPLVFKNLCVVSPGGMTGSALVAYNRMSGEPVWKGGSHGPGYSSPILAMIHGTQQILMYYADGVAGHDAATGQELWHFPWSNINENNIVQPIVREDGTVFISSGYGTGSALVEPSKSGSSWSVKSRWEAPNQFKLKFNGGVYRDGCVYGLDEGILSCFDATAGKRRWRAGRYKYGQVLLLDDILLVISESGEVAIVEISPEKSREIAKFQAIDGKTWNHPVVNRGRLYVRNSEQAACYDLR